MKQIRIIHCLALLTALAMWPLLAQDKAVPASVGATVPQDIPAVSVNYRLSPGDLIYVKVFQEDDLSSSLRIGDDGTITFPLIGTVKVGGLTVAEATKAISLPLDEHYLVNPQITVTVLSFTDRHVTILGQVEHAGTYNLKEQSSLDILEAIGLAGGFTRLADTTDVMVRRLTDGKASIIRINARKIAKDSEASNFEVLPGDTITVQERIF